MTIHTHTNGNKKTAEIVSDEVIINNAEDAINLLGDLYFGDYSKLIIYEKDIVPEFFNLRTGIAGEILQKFSNYRIELAIVGNFEKHTSQSIRNFIYESNKGKHINFVKSIEEAIQR